MTEPEGHRQSAPGMALFETPIGRVAVAWQGPTVLAVQLPEGEDERTRQRLRAKVPAATPADPPPPIVRAMASMTALLQGESEDLAEVDIDLSACSDFDRAVYEVTRSIPPGRSLTYGQVAERIGEPGAAQAVGRSLGANPIPIIVPCHRVLGAGGRLTGFSAAGGIDTKRRMLLIEGCPEVPPSLFD